MLLLTEPFLIDESIRLCEAVWGRISAWRLPLSECVRAERSCESKGEVEGERGRVSGAEAATVAAARAEKRAAEEAVLWLQCIAVLQCCCCAAVLLLHT